KYAEGYPGARYYQGCGFYDQVETIAIERAKQLFGCKHANVQAHSGANANLAAFMSLMQPGDSFISLNLASGGHLSHGMKLNTSAVFYKPAHYELDATTETIDFNSVLAKAINRSVFPGSQGGPLMHIIAAKAVAFGEDLRPEFRTYAQQIVKNARALADALMQRGHRLVSGGTDNHLMLVDLRARSSNL